MNIKREQEDYFLNILKTSKSPHNVVLIVGARQVGKTTFINQSIEQYTTEVQALSINLEEDLTFCADIDSSKNFSDFESLLTLKGLNLKKRQILFIDEAQESSQIGHYIRFMKEKWPKTQVILSGSSMSRIFRNNQRYPVGRVTILKLNPFSFYEFLDAGNFGPLKELCFNFNDSAKISSVMHEKLLEKMDQYLQVGGLPEVVLDFFENKDYKLTRRSILLAQENDFVRKTMLANKDLFMAALAGVANFLGSVSKYTHISNSTSRASEIISILKAWHHINEVEQKGISSTTKFFPKRYIYDIGIAVQVRNMPFPKISILQTIDQALRAQLGGLFENLVYLQLNNYKMSQVEISGWKESNKNQVEVDFIYHGNISIPIECKASKNITNRSFSGLLRYLKISGLKFGIIISASPYSLIKQDDILLVNLPIYLAHPQIIESIVHNLKN